MPVMTTGSDDEIAVFLRRAMKEAGISQYDVADALGKTQAWVSAYLFRKPGETLKRLWLKDEDAFDRLAAILKVNRVELLRVIGLFADESAVRSNATVIPLERIVPVYPAGAGPALDDVTAVEYVPIPRQIGGSYEVFGLKAVGNSMSPYLRNGEIALIAAEPSLAEPGKKIGVYIPHEGHQIKELVEIDDTGNIWLRSLNPADDEPTVFRAPEGTIIKGRVIKRLKDD